MKWGINLLAVEKCSRIILKKKDSPGKILATLATDISRINPTEYVLDIFRVCYAPNSAYINA